jgi:hypothetical protein
MAHPKKRKRRGTDWHHRVPDFKLVYCGSEKRNQKEETKLFSIKRLVDVSDETETNEINAKE